MQLQEKRFDSEAAERKRLADEREADLQRVKNAERSRHPRRRRRGPQEDESEWRGAAQTGSLVSGANDAGPSVQGVFQRLDCLEPSARVW